MRQLVFKLRRPVLFAYALLAISLSLVLALLAWPRGAGEFSLWLTALLGLALLSVRLPTLSPLVAGVMAFALGFVKTYRGGLNLDLGLSLIALAVGLSTLRRVRRSAGPVSLDLAGLALLGIAVWSLVSVGFSLVRIRSFSPAPGFGYQTYWFNPAGLSSEEAVIRAVIGATTMFTWFGLYEWARSAEMGRKGLNVTIFVMLLANGVALLVQRHVDPGFLHPVGFHQIGRLNGVTSFCYALGDAVLSLFLLLPAWGARSGWLGALTVGSLLMLTHAAVASGSRTALATMLLATVLWSGLRILRLHRTGRRLRALLALAAVAGLVGLAALAYHHTPPDQATPLGRLKDGIERQGLYGHLFAVRLSSYPLIFRVMAEYPLSGVGAGLYMAEVGKQHALLTPDLEVPEPYLLSSYAPNQFLNTGVELGLPALAALALVFFLVAAAPLVRRRSPGSADIVLSLLALATALQLGPSFYNSEALVFSWLIIGLCARAGLAPDTAGVGAPRARVVGTRATAALVGAALVLAMAGHLQSLPRLAVDRQWTELRWRLAMGLRPKEPAGRWTGPQATFVVDSETPTLIVRWHTGDRAAPGHRPVVSFYVDGELKERSLATPGAIRKTALPLPAAAGLKRISVLVSPPFVPAEVLGGDDRRSLGIFIHSLTPIEEEGSKGSARRAPGSSP